MGLFGLFGKKRSGTVTAHILDPLKGFYQEEWIIGEHIPNEVVDKLGDANNVYIIVAYEGGQRKQAPLRRADWEQARVHFSRIDEAGDAIMRRTMDELKKLR